MSRETHSAGRRGNEINIFIYDGRRDHARRALEIAREVAEPHEALYPPVRDRDGCWIVEIDTVRSGERKAVLEMVLDSLRETDQTFDRRADGRLPLVPNVNHYLRGLRETLEILDELP